MEACRGLGQWVLGQEQHARMAAGVRMIWCLISHLVAQYFNSATSPVDPWESTWGSTWDQHGDQHHQWIPGDQHGIRGSTWGSTSPVDLWGSTWGSTWDQEINMGSTWGSTSPVDPWGSTWGSTSPVDPWGSTPLPLIFYM
eukprot:1155044-Pelagomonas_calceolata.AAC.1